MFPISCYLSSKLRLSYDEVCVLLDCLSIAKADKWMTFETDRKNVVPSSEDKPIDVSDKTLSLILKKKNIEKSKYLLKNFMEKINKLENELNSNRFHMELYRARQLWRIRKIGTKFNCDLSYRSVGCVNSMKANFELIKTDKSYVKPEKNVNQTQLLSVIVPEEYKENFFIKVEIVNSIGDTIGESLFENNFSLFSKINSIKPLNHLMSWQDRLEQAQNTIFCKEIFNQLLREVFDKKNSQDLRPVVIGNSIRIMATQENDLIISLVNTDRNTGNVPVGYNFNNSVLEYFLHDLLKKCFEQNFFHYDQRPITSTFAYNSHVKIAGMAYVNLNSEEDNSISNLPKSISHLLNRKRKINVLQSIKEIAEHLLIRQKVLTILNRVCQEISEPNFFVEPCLWNSSCSTDIRVTISSHYYDTLSKSSFFILIKENQVNVLNRSDNINLSFTDFIDNLRYYFIDQCCFHQINLIVSLSQMMGWNIIGSTFTNEQNSLIMRGTVFMCNDSFEKKLALKIPSVNQMELYVFQYGLNATDDYKTEELDYNKEDGWVYVKENYTYVDIENYPGLTQVQKYELFLAHFSTDENILI